jgi:photosystem II stability/assembly factor-like uncharacterized protein
MTVRPAADGSIFVAGHNVFVASGDGGVKDVDADLPSLDIHAFARDPADPDRMWAYLAEGGVYESQDRGRSWDLVFGDHVPQLVPVVTPGGTELIGLAPFAGITRSSDGGRTWREVSRPPGAPVVSLAATPDGAVVLVGVDDGVYRSSDGARTWSRVLDVELPLALAVSEDGKTIVAVTRATDFYRSDDGGRTWPGPP